MSFPFQEHPVNWDALEVQVLAWVHCDKPRSLSDAVDHVARVAGLFGKDRAELARRCGLEAAPRHPARAAAMPERSHPPEEQSLPHRELADTILTRANGHRLSPTHLNDLIRDVALARGVAPSHIKAAMYQRDPAYAPVWQRLETDAGRG